MNELDNIDNFKRFFNFLKQSTELPGTFIWDGCKFKGNINRKDFNCNHSVHQKCNRSAQALIYSTKRHHKARYNFFQMTNFIKIPRLRIG